MAIRDTFIPVYYNISIAAGSLGGSAPADGFIDNTTPEIYGNLSSLPSTRAFSQAKERANMRYEELIRRLSTTISPVIVTGVTATNGGPDAEADPFSLTVGYDKPEFVRTEDEDNAGIWFTGTAAIQRFVARALITDLTNNRDFYNPALVGNVAQGSMIETVEADALAANIATAESATTVIEVDLTT